MAQLNAFEFASSIQSECDQSYLIDSYDVQILDDTVVKIRAFLADITFIDVFYNVGTRKCSYTLIKNKRRVFGADNSFIGWHIHPFENPNVHQLSPELSFAEFLRYIEINMYR